jgi:outer membrane cobalamin receptor
MHQSRHAVGNVVVLIVYLAVVGCGGSAQRASQPTGPARRVVTADQIAKSGAKSGWDALRFTMRSISMKETRDGRPARIERRGNSSLYLDDQVQVFLDGLRIFAYEVLDDMPASDIERIEVLSGVDATTRYGTNAADGVIVIYTRLTGEGEAVDES